MTQLLTRAGVIVSAFLQGGFARKTMLAPLRDIDKIVIMAGRLADQPDLQAGPELAMDRIEAVLARAYPHARFSRSRHALKVDFGTDTFSFDIVPAFETLTIDDDVLIADIKDNRWERSNTRELIRTERLDPEVAALAQAEFAEAAQLAAKPSDWPQPATTRPRSGTSFSATPSPTHPPKPPAMP
jgi:hypothetical protein